MPDHKCKVCDENIAKYTCPRCKLKTCSLACVKRHKKDKSCNGVRDKTAYIPVNKFTETDLLSDYRFLEDTARKVNSINRDELRKKKNRIHWVQFIIQTARYHGVNLLTLSYPMSRRVENSTRVIKKDKDHIINWKIDLIFPQASVKYTESSVDENTKIEELLIKYTSPTQSDPVIRQKLKQYVQCGPEGYKIFLMVEKRPSNDKRFYELDREKTLKDNLHHKTIVEHPVLYIVLNNKAGDYQLLSQEEMAVIIEKVKAEVSKPAPPGWSKFNKNRPFKDGQPRRKKCKGNT